MSGPTGMPADRPEARGAGADAAPDPVFTGGLPEGPMRGSPDAPGPGEPGYAIDPRAVAPDRLWRRALRMPRILIGGGVLVVMISACLLSLPWTLNYDSSLSYDRGNPMHSIARPLDESAVRDVGPILALFGFDEQGRSILARVLMGGVISLSVGVAAAAISVVLGVGVGLLSGYAGGKVDAALMRFVDIMYGLPYILLVIMFQVALSEPLRRFFEWIDVFQSPRVAANLTVLFLAIGLVSWLTMARVVRGQVLSLRNQPFVEAARASGLRPMRIFWRHLLPNLVGPILVYATLTVPQAVLQESFLSFLGIGIQPPLPSWGWLAADGLAPTRSTFNPQWWRLVFPCLALAVTLLSLNFLGDGLRDLFDPKRETAKL